MLLGAGARPGWAQSVLLAWSPSPSPTVAYYNVYYGTESGVYVNTLTSTNASQTVIAGLNWDTTYYFAVAAVDGSGNESALSDEASYTVPPAAAVELEVLNATNTTDAVEAIWSASTNQDVYGYQISYGTEPDQYTNSVTFYDTTNGIISGLVGGETYYFAVSPIDSLGVEPVDSNIGSFVVPAPASILLTAQAAANMTGVALDWDAVADGGIVGYMVFYGTTSGVYTGSEEYGLTTNAVIEGLQSGQTYYFMVASVDGYGNESFSSEEAACVAPAPLPLQLAVQPSGLGVGSVSVSWTASPETDVYGYVVYYGTDSTFYSGFDAFYDTTNGVISGLQPGGTYYFTLAPVNSFGTEDVASAPVSCVVPVPETIALTAQVSTNPAGVELSWNTVTNIQIESYNVSYGTQSRDYSTVLNFGDATNAVLQGLNGGQTYYFSVSAVDAAGNQGPPSNEASAAVPEPPPVVLQTTVYSDDNGQPYLMEVYSAAAIFGSWEMDYSTDLINWSPYEYGYGYGLGDGNDVAAYTFLDPTVPQMFFRVVQP